MGPRRAAEQSLMHDGCGDDSDDHSPERNRLADFDWDGLARCDAIALDRRSIVGICVDHNPRSVRFLANVCMEF